MPLTTAEEKTQKRLEVKARSTLMMGIPNQHQLKFNSIKDARLLMEAAQVQEQNLAFVFLFKFETIAATNGRASTHSSVNLANGVFAANTQVNASKIDNLSDAVICMKLLSSGNESVAWITQSGVLQYTRRNILLKEYWSDQAEEGSNYALMAYLSLKSDSEETSCLIHLIVPFSFTGLDEFVNKPVVENRKSDEEVSKVVRKSNDSPIIKDWVSDSEEENVSQTKTEKKTFWSICTVDCTLPSKSAFKIIGMEKPIWNNAQRQNISKTAVLVNTARQVNTAHSKTTVNAARLMVNTVRGKEVNTARPKAVVNVVKGNNVNAIKASACWVWKPKTKVLDHGIPQIDLQDKGVIDSGCSRNMIGNMSYLTDYKEIDGGYVAFGGNPKEGKITGKCTIKTGFFVGYSLNSKAFRVFNSRTRIVEENLHIRFSENTPNVVGTKASDNVGQETKEIEHSKDYILLLLWTADPLFSKDPKSYQDDRSKPSSDDGKKVDDDSREESESIELLVDPDCLLEDYNIFEDDEDVGAEADMNNLGTHKKKGIDYDEVFALVARIKAIRLFLAYVSFKDFVVYQMDVKSAFLYGKIKEEVYVCQPPGFEDPDFPNRVYKVEKALYGLHQAPRAWYETLSTYLLDNGFQRGKIDKTLFIKRHKGDILLVQVYVDDIIFGSTKKELCNAFEKLMHKKFQMSSMGELTFFLGL
ncbi:putative ribonuclease H-like domain-containing protein [Tanacetum coccineum]|uniref:Ribonuclease H-like domain-containing protein n=1 Tax=Tanacetum coccineum TaxID=301880 RepID=A0ABQ5J799_9ASTR